MYYLNTENTDLDNDDQVHEAVAILVKRGYTVEFTRNFGAVNHEECPVPDWEWQDVIEQAEAVSV